MSERTRRFWHKTRVKRFCWALLVALGVSCVLSALFDRDSVGQIRRGDFPAFYAAAVILAKGEGERLYDQELQQSIENTFWPSLDGSYYAFAYPPYAAVVLRPLAELGPLAAKLLLTGAMAVLLLCAAIMISKILPRYRASELTVFAVLLSFGPVFSGVMAGQNIALSLFCYLAAMLLLKRYGPRGEFSAGLMLGMWAFKPHFAFLALVFFLAARRFRVLLGALVVFVGWYLIGVLVQGWGWPLSWLLAVQAFSESDFVANQHQMVSLIGVSKAISWELGSCGTQAFLAFAAAAAGGVFLCSLYVFFIAGKMVRKSGDYGSLVRAMYFVGPAVVLLSPHTLYYELGLLLPAAAFLFYPGRDRNVWLLIMVWVLTFVVSLIKNVLGVQPLFVLALVVWAMLYRQGSGCQSGSTIR